MENLWKKESTENGEIYVDLFKQFENSESARIISQWKQLKLDKNNNFSTKHRLQGNHQFENNNFEEAMELFNQSLCFAECGSENVGLAYANRAFCFMKLEMYEEALIDIDLAKNANYPTRLMSKLENRRANCVRMIETKPTRKQFQPKLSLNADEQIPYMANALEIKRSQKYGRCVMAKCDIDVGKTILVEPIFASGWAIIQRVSCSTCFKTKANFISCPNCSITMYCNTNCMELDNAHKLICGETLFFVHPLMEYFTRTILTGLNLFTSSEEMMKFVEDAVMKNSHKIPKSLIEQKSKYKLFLKLENGLSEADKKDFISQIYELFTVLYSVSSIKKLFDSEKKKRFLQHLVAHHILISMKNGYGYAENRIGLSPISCLINHSCAPNIQIIGIGNQMVAVTIRPMKKGDQVFANYQDHGKSTKDRRDILMKKYGFFCECDKCEPHCTSSDQAKMEMDATFEYIVHNVQAAFDDKSKRDVLKRKCISFLQKYGHLPWSQELELVTASFMIVLQKNFIDS